ncbi:hypothetical protein [Thalassotalea sediminis]|uniref:hypothetical protein n=1 Tax=Thalassotalea sediminis TaxID=1759089 RepID=UPI002573E39B|nr:hypothetical protein [Thalassotalea sediminis]
MKLSHLLFWYCITCTSLPTWASDNPFIGTWQLVSGEYLNENKEIIAYSTLGIRSQKVINASHFSFVSFSDDKFWAAGTGQYSFNATQYIETPTMASYPLEGDGTYTFTYEIKGDQWHNARWHDGIRVEYEIWQKVK